MASRSIRIRFVGIAVWSLLGAACSTDAVGEQAASVSSSVLPSTTPVTTTSTTVTMSGTTIPAGSTSSTSTPPTSSPPTTVSPTTTTATTATTTTTTTTTTTATTTTTTPPPARDGSIYDVRPPSDLRAPPLPEGWVTQSLGTSVQGRDITALVRQVDSPNRAILVVGGIHGNEPASPPTVRSLVEAVFGDDVDVWLVPELNPDGVAAGTRWNANGVDLNRNFNWDWRPSDGGPGPLSEPESRAIADFIAAARPGVVVWVHQPYGYVSSVGGTDRSFESAWSAGSGLPVRSGVTQHGGGESWTFFDAELPSMLIEIDSWDATETIVDAQRAGFQALLTELGWDR
jgi:murein peptide amidase A